MHLFVDNLTNVDFSYLDNDRGLVGETWLASITLDGALDEQGMVCDFGIVKKTVRQWLDDTIDHCLVVAADAKQLRYSTTDHSTAIEWYFGEQYSLKCESPSQAITMINSQQITPESVAQWCIEQLRPLLPDTIDKIQLSFVPETIAHSFYHYSHGLKKHDGNCQRIAHGHRSTIAIFQDNERNHQLEQQWCEKWQDIYIGTRDDLIKADSHDGIDYYHFAYQAPQGEFSLSIPQACCDLIDTDSTVEYIAQHIATSLKQQYPQHQFTVRAYEGMGKGAVAFA